MATDIILPLRKVFLDIVLLMCVGFPILFIFLWGAPFQRGFFCNDEDLMHPYHPSTVPSYYLYIVGILLNCVVMILIEYLNQRQSNQKIIFWRWIIPNWSYNAYYVILVFAFGMACSQLTTDVMKYTVGRLRPHFITVCAPDIDCTLPSKQHIYHIDFNCTGKYKNDARLIKEMRLSFPSGHSSFSIYTMLYFAIYLQKRMDWDGSKLLKHTLQFLAVLAAIFVAMTRISDYKHHWSDVLGGLVIGTITACITDFTLKTEKKVPWAGSIVRLLPYLLFIMTGWYPAVMVKQLPTLKILTISKTDARVFSTLFEECPNKEYSLRTDIVDMQGVNGNNTRTV